MNIEILKNILPLGNKYQGLKEIQINAAVAKYGLNVRPIVENKTWLKRATDIATEPMIILLLIATIIYFFIGKLSEALIILFSMIPVVTIEFIQENRTDQALKELDKIMVEFCQVYRDGQIKKMETKYLVPGDLVYLTAGDKAPADGVLINSYGLMVDESMLTGESASVAKANTVSEKNISEENKVYQNTLIVQGEGYLLITDTGLHTAYGQLGTLLQKIKRLGTPLQNNIHRLVRSLAIVAIAVSAIIAFILTYNYGLINGVLGAITIAIALIPEEFPIVFSVFLIMGVWRMTKQRALIREMAMVEILGSATVICTDKTGTLTQGKMALEKLYFAGKIFEKNHFKKDFKKFEPLIKNALLSLEQIAIDPMEIEIQNFASENKIDIQKFFAEHSLLQDLPFETQSKMVHHLYQSEDFSCRQYSGGAPENIIANSNLEELEKQKIKKIYEEMANDGYRVIAIATSDCSKDKQIKKENLDFVGLLAMSDPPRAGVKEAIDICQKAKIRVIMITGDNALTAHHIAEEIGLKHNEVIINGQELEKISKKKLKQIVKHHDIFSRIKPEQKLMIVEALQANGEIVAMTGDGVNDAPALKQSNIGIAMGQKGTDVARAAAGMVLLDDNFTTIVGAVREGRKIYDNLRQAFVFLFTFHIPIVILSLLPLFLGKPLIFLPIHIIFLELLCDPAAVIGFENEKAHRQLMNQPPRPAKESLINKKMLLKTFIYGIGITILSFGFYQYYAISNNQLEIGRTLAISALIISQTLMIIFGRDWEQVKSNKVILSILLAILIILALAIYLESWHYVFRFETLNLNQIILLIGITIPGTFILSRIEKIFR